VHNTVVLVPLSDGRSLALELDAYQAALERANTITLPSVSDEIVDAAGMEARTQVPSTWWLEAARRDDVPHLRCGKYVRFRVTEAIAAMERTRTK